jgi:hypothetical protein
MRLVFFTRIPLARFMHYVSPGLDKECKQEKDVPLKENLM